MADNTTIGGSSSYSISDLVSNLTQYRFNPAAIQRESLRMVTAVSNGEIDFVDPTNPVILCMEASASAVSAFMVEHAVESRRRYPKLAQTQEDLYLHMSDKDYVDRFATPAAAKFTFLIEKEKLIGSLKDDPTTGYKKITIPRNTYFEIADMQFALQYPIDIKQLAHGGLQIVYDTTKMSPLQSLETNEIDYEIRTNEEGDWVAFTVPTNQFSVIDNSDSISPAADFSMRMRFTDLYYYTRVYHQNADGTWSEIATTHSDTVYDINTPTAVLQVVDKVLTIKIPQIYVTTGQLSRKIRAELYQTKGAINIALGEYPSTSLAIVWKAYDPADITTYTAPLSNLTVIAFSDDTVTAGSNGLTFEELRTNVIQNTTGPIDDSITPAQIEKALKDKGYDVVKNIDRITNRVFLATRSMPSPTVITPTTAATTGTQLLTAASATIETLTFNTNELVQLPTVVDNTTSITITPDTIYQTVSGITQPIQNSDLQALLALPADKRAQAITDGNYSFAPFHYVLDMTNNAFEARPYYLDNPTVESKLFVRQNDTTLLQVSTDRFDVFRTTNGYSIIILTKSSSDYQALEDSQVFAQLSYIPYGERDRAYLNGTMLSKTSTGERYFRFDLDVNFNVDSNDNIEFTKFTMYNTDPRITKSPLYNSFDILYSTSAVMPATWTANSVDQNIGKYLLPLQSVGIAQETLRVRLGYALSKLWSRARTVIGSTPYKTYSVDVPAYYKDDIYETDANGSAVQIVDGALVINILHHKGDPVLDTDGNQAYEHRAGDIMYDNSGNPVPADARGLQRQVDLFLLEGAYWFATDATSTDYRQRMVKTVVSWLVNDLGSFTGRLLDQTTIYFYPKTTAGLIQVLVGDSIPKFINANQTFVLTLAVSKQVYTNLNLRDRLSKTSIATISDALTQKTVAISQIVESLRKVYSNDVIDVQLTGLGGSENNYSVVTVVDDTDRLSIAKRLTALADDTLVVEEAVTINFVQHDA